MNKVINYSQRNRFLRRLMYFINDLRAKKYMIKRILPLINISDRILDIGAGPCNICKILKEQGYNITPLDIQNVSFVDNIKPILYNGIKIPFDKQTFDVALLLTVLHHTKHPDKIIKEAKRVSKRIIIIEDIYNNVLNKYLTFFFDSLTNFEFKGHPHTNRNDEQWKDTFKKLGLKLIDFKYSHYFPVFKHGTYILENLNSYSPKRT
jgi:2-polyprenyl-3-methyl-5-hydroxy-6-metoxy-1,4-benzoquinol methylase